MTVVAFRAITRGKEIQVHGTTDPDALMAHAGPVNPETNILESAPGSQVFKALCGRGLDWYQIFDPKGPMPWDLFVDDTMLETHEHNVCRRCVTVYLNNKEAGQ